MSVLMQFFQIAAIVTVMLTVSDAALGIFAIPLAGINPQTGATFNPSLTDTNTTSIEQTATAKTAPTANITGLAELTSAIKNVGNTQRVITFSFAQVDSTQTGDFSETIAGFLNGILTIFFFLGLAYVPIAIVAAFLGGGAP